MNAHSSLPESPEAVWENTIKRGARMNSIPIEAPSRNGPVCEYIRRIVETINGIFSEISPRDDARGILNMKGSDNAIFAIDTILRDKFADIFHMPRTCRRILTISPGDVKVDTTGVPLSRNFCDRSVADYLKNLLSPDHCEIEMHQITMQVVAIVRIVTIAFMEVVPEAYVLGYGGGGLYIVSRIPGTDLTIKLTIDPSPLILDRVLLDNSMYSHIFQDKDH